MTSDSSTAATQQDGTIVLGAQCTEEECEWLLGTDTPESWDIVEQLRLTHENDTGHQTTVEVVRQRTILAGEFDGMEMDDFLLEHVEDGAIEWICPECHHTDVELNASKRCPECDEPFREVLP